MQSFVPQKEAPYLFLVGGAHISEVQPAAEILAVSVDHGHLRDTCGQSVKAYHAILGGRSVGMTSYQNHHNKTHKSTTTLTEQQKSQYRAIPTPEL